MIERLAPGVETLDPTMLDLAAFRSAVREVRQMTESQLVRINARRSVELVAYRDKTRILSVVLAVCVAALAASMAGMVWMQFGQLRDLRRSRLRQTALAKELSRRSPRPSRRTGQSRSSSPP